MERILYSDWIPPSCPLGGVSGVGPGSKSPLFGHIINALLTKLVRSRWLDISLILFEFFIDLDFIPEGGGGGYFRNFWVGVCRWDPGTLSVYQS